MEDLTKQQLILTVLLVSFVTSIATGIVTVSLVQQAPQGVSQTINRVVQETVQTVSPSSSGTPNTSQTASAANSQKVVTEDDLITAAVSKNSKSLVRISGSVPPNEPAYLGLGVIVSKSGVVVAPENVLSLHAVYSGALADGTTATLDFLAYNDETQTAYFEIDKGTPSTQSFTPVTLGNSDDLAIGQGVIALGGVSRDIIAQGVVTSLITGNGGLALIQTNTTLNEVGAPLIDLSGNVIGLSTTDAGVDLEATGQNSAVFLPSNIIAAQIAAALQTATSTAASTSGKASTPVTTNAAASSTDTNGGTSTIATTSPSVNH